MTAATSAPIGGPSRPTCSVSAAVTAGTPLTVTELVASPAPATVDRTALTSRRAPTWSRSWRGRTRIATVSGAGTMNRHSGLACPSAPKITAAPNRALFRVGSPTGSPRTTRGA